MNRRGAVKDLLIASGGLIALPWWMQACRLSDKDTHASSFSEGEQMALAQVVDSLIPAGQSIGALAVGVDKYLQKLLDDCYESSMRKTIKKQLRALGSRARSGHGCSFDACTQQQRETLLLQWASSQDPAKRAAFNLIKSETIHGYNTSQQVLEGYFGYQVAPGHYFGCVPRKA
jgi:hypothetical protein